MIKTSSKLLSYFKYIYLVIFFALLSGFFYPLITITNYDDGFVGSFAFIVDLIRVIHGILILFLGLVGGILLYKAATSEKKNMSFLGVGFTLITISLYFIFQISGRI